MPSKPTDVDALRIELDEDGTATLSGINYADLRSILNTASLHRYDHPFEAEPLDGTLDDVRHANNVDNASWHLAQRLIHDVLDARMADAVSPKHGGGAAKIRSAKASYEWSLRTLDVDVRKAEIEAAAKKAGEIPVPDPLTPVTKELREAIRLAGSALAQIERLDRAALSQHGEQKDA